MSEFEYDYEVTLNSLGIPTRYKNGKKMGIGDLLTVIAKNWNKLGNEDKKSVADEINKEVGGDE